MQQQQQQPVGAGDLLLVGLLIGLIVVSIVGNCLVCVAIFTDRRLRKLGNAFIVSLAIADLFVSCLVMTFALCNDLMQHWIFGEWFCDVWISFDIMCSTASILNLCAISLDRFVHIKDCLLYNRWMTRRVALSAVVGIWFISALVSFVPINLGWHKPEHQWLSSPPSSSHYLPAKLDYLRAAPERDRRQLQQQQQQLLRQGSSGPMAVQFNQVEPNPQDGQLNLTGKLNFAPPEADAPRWTQQQRPQLLAGSNQSLASSDKLPTCALSLTPTYAIISSTISFYIPCIIMLGLYTKLFACARRHVRNIQAISKAPAPIPSSRSQLQLATATATAAPEDQLAVAGPLRTWLKLPQKRPRSTRTKPNAQQQQQITTQLSAPANPAPAPAPAPDADADRPMKDKAISRPTNLDAICRQHHEQQQPFIQCENNAEQPPITRANKSNKVNFASSPNTQQQQQQANQVATHKAAVTLGIIMGTFLFCWVPFFCLNIIKSLCQDCISPQLFRAFTWLGYANSALNPVIYGIHNSEFRQAFNRIFFKHLNIKNSRYYLHSAPSAGPNSRHQQQARRHRPSCASSHLLRTSTNTIATTTSSPSPNNDNNNNNNCQLHTESHDPADAT